MAEISEMAEKIEVRRKDKKEKIESGILWLS